MGRPDYIPQDYKRVKVVDSLSELFNEKFGGPEGVNVIHFSRPLTMDFNPLAHLLADRLGLVENKKSQRSLMCEDARGQMKHLDHWARKSLGIILRDMDQVRELGVTPRLRVVAVAGYNFPIAYQFHEDRVKKTDNGRLMSCYVEPVTEGLRNCDAVYEGGQIYIAKPDALPFRFMPGDVWKHAAKGQGVEPFIHRAVQRENGTRPRLLMVAE